MSKKFITAALLLVLSLPLFAKSGFLAGLTAGGAVQTSLSSNANNATLFANGFFGGEFGPVSLALEVPVSYSTSSVVRQGLSLRPFWSVGGGFRFTYQINQGLSLGASCDLLYNKMEVDQAFLSLQASLIPGFLLYESEHIRLCGETPLTFTFREDIRQLSLAIALRLDFLGGGL